MGDHRLQRRSYWGSTITPVAIPISSGAPQLASSLSAQHARAGKLSYSREEFIELCLNAGHLVGGVFSERLLSETRMFTVIV
jgi:hypothetical protein